MKGKDVGFADVLFCLIEKKIKKSFFLFKNGITFTSTNNKTTIKMKQFISLMIGEDFNTADIKPALILVGKVILILTIVSILENL